MVVLRLFLFFIVLVFLNSCTNDQFVEIIEPIQTVVGPNILVGVWSLDSVKITTKEHPVQEGVAYEVLVWVPSPDEKDTLVIDENFFSWSKNNNSHEYSVDSVWINVYNQDTSRFLIVGSSAHSLSFSSFGVYENSSASGGEKRVPEGDSLRIDSVYYFSNPTYYEVSFASDIYEKIIYNNGAGKCMPCHGVGTPYPVQLQPIQTAYNSLFYGFSSGGSAYVDTINPGSSFLYKTILGENGITIMPPLSNNNGGLSNQDVEMIYLWISQGARNN